MKKRIGIIMLILIVLSGCTTKPKVIFSEVNEMEYGEDPMQLITETDAEEIAYAWKDADGNELSEEELKTDTAYQLVFTAYKENKEMEFTKEITLIDTTAPTVEAKKKEIIIEYGSEEFDFNAWVEENLSFQDNVTPKDKLIIEGIEQLSSIQEGIFDLIIKDESQNGTKISIQVILKDTTAPIITAKKTTFLIDEQDEIPDFSAYAHAWDNKDGEVKIEIKKEKDFQGPGQYQLFFSATDQAQNEAILPFICIISSKNIHENTDENSSAPLTKTEPELKIDDDFFELDQRNLNACIERGNQSGSCNWECIPNGDGTYIYMQYD